MPLEVIGAGFGRTGTLSLKLALEQLGFLKTYHMVEVFSHPDHIDFWAEAAAGRIGDWEALFEGYRAAVDWPACAFWAPLMARYPEAKVILTSRDPDRWYDSVMNTIYPATRTGGPDEPEAVRRQRAMADRLIWQHTFDDRMDDRAHVIAVYEAHNQRVRESVPADRLLDFRAADGWAPLCGFLDVPVPDAPFPNVNSTEDFRQRRLAPDA